MLQARIQRFVVAGVEEGVEAAGTRSIELAGTAVAVYLEQNARTSHGSSPGPYHSLHERRSGGLANESS
jgi:hypothetical protein